jgi:hypothetical protein
VKSLNTPVEVVIPSWQANLASFIVFVLVAGMGGMAFASIHGFALAWAGFVIFLTHYSTLFITIIVGAIAHELLHAVGFALGNTRGWRSVRFGFSVKDLAPYTHCSDELSFQSFMLATLLPGIILGFAPLILSLILGDGWLFAFSCFFTAGAGGDFLCAYRMVPFRHYRIRDHADSIGFVVL